MKISYIDKNFSRSTLDLIEACNEIIDEFDQQGFTLTLRQLYYQLVTREVIANRQTEYKRLGSIVNDARWAGLIDWLAIEDRTRNLRSLPTWTHPANIINSAISQYRIDFWSSQRYRPEVWIEKDALTGVISGVCNSWRVPYFSCRGYVSASEIWTAAQRALGYTAERQKLYIIHLGDHDPSGLDMTRDIRERLAQLSDFQADIEVSRIALSYDQVDLYRLPPNPAKVTDSRYDDYAMIHGDESWELDALNPITIVDLIEQEIKSLADSDKWQASIVQEENGKKLLEKAKDAIMS
jgi:hypothetical protein